MNIIPESRCKSTLELFSFTTCGHCNAVIEQETAVMSVYYTDHGQEHEHFCGNDCKQKWYLQRLNTAGM